MRRFFFAALLVLAVAIAIASPALAKPPVKLVVVVMIDQLGTGYWLRGEPLFDGGLARLARRGMVYPNGVHAHANTATGPGHADVLTGAWPSVHGMVSNVWYERGSKVYCVSDPKVGITPRRLEAPTIADALRLSSRGRSRVVSLALKDRVAVIMGGQSPDVAAWWDPQVNAFVRGTYASTSLAFSMAPTNAAHAAIRAKNLPWLRLRPELDYVALASADDGAHEGLVQGLGRTFPHAYGLDIDAEAYRVSPLLLDALIEMSGRAVDELALGQRGQTDVLLIGLTSLDYAGHYWGPTSQEALDVLLRSDRALGALIDRVEEKLGPSGVLWVVSGDHGVALAPEETVAYGGRARRVDGNALAARVNAALAPLAQKGRKPTSVALLDPPLLWLDHADPTADRLVLARAAAKALMNGPELLEAHASDDVGRFGEQYRVMFERVLFPGRAPEVMFLQRPYDLVDVEHHTGSGHGSPYVYDTHVPIVLAGPGVRAGRDMTPYDVTRIAPTIAALLGIEAPAAALEKPLP